MLPIKVLICDDTLKESTIRRELDELVPRVIWTLCRTIEEGRQAARDNSFDIAFVDYTFSTQPGKENGVDLLYDIRDIAPSCHRVLMTRSIAAGAQEVFDYALLPNREDRLVLVNKSDPTQYIFRAHIETIFKTRFAQQWALPDVADVVAGLTMMTGDTPNLRSDRPEELTHEVQRILFDIFDVSASTKLAGEPVQLQAGRIEMGRSGSIALQVSLNYGKDESGGERPGRDVLGMPCIVKFGRRASIEEEVERYRQYVQMGVPSNFRVELLNVSLGDGVGGACYSYAGGAAAKIIESLDTILRDRRTKLAREVIEALFNPDPKIRSWDAIRGPDMLIASFYRNSAANDLRTKAGAVHAFVKKAKVGSYDAETRKWTVGSQTVRLPDPERMGDDPWRTDTPTCLIHGDMHGGNLLVGDGTPDKVFMIDFADVGIGPRFADAAALASTVRLESPFDEPLDDEAVLAKIITAESRLASPTFNSDDLTRHGETNWVELAAVVNHRALQNAMAPDAKAELSQTQLAYALSIFEWPWWSKMHKLRLATWIGALLPYVEGSS
jgi:hypothetical protein